MTCYQSPASAQTTWRCALWRCWSWRAARAACCWGWWESEAAPWVTWWITSKLWATQRLCIVWNHQVQRSRPRACYVVKHLKQFDVCSLCCIREFMTHFMVFGSHLQYITRPVTMEANHYHNNMKYIKNWTPNVETESLLNLLHWNISWFLPS